MLALGMRF